MKIQSRLFHLLPSVYNCHYEKLGDTVKKIDLELPQGWQFCRLSLVCWLNNGEKTSGEKLPYLDARTLRGKTEKTILDNGIIVSEGEKVILVDGENSGEVFIVPYRGYMGSTFKILQMVSIINVEFIKIILDYYKDILKESKTGAAIPHLNKQLLKSIIIGVPPIEEQDRIVNQVQQIMQYIDLLENNQNEYADLVEILKKAVLQSAIQGNLVEQVEDDEPASVLLEKIRAEKKAQLGRKYVESYIYKSDDNRYYEHIDDNDVDITEEIPYDLPKNWCWSRIQDISDSYIGLTYKPTDIVQNDGWIVLRSSNIQDGKLDLNDIVRVNVPISEKLTVKKNDIIICARNGSKKLVGKSAIVDIDLPNLTFGAFMAICKTPLYAYVAKFLLSSLFFDQLRNVCGTTTINQLTQNNFNKFLIPIPPLAEQERIVNKINEIFAHL